MLKTLVSIKKVNRHRAWLVFRWVTLSRRVKHLGICNQLSKSYFALTSHPSVGIGPVSGLVMYAGVWLSLRALETDISAVLWRLRKTSFLRAKAATAQKTAQKTEVPGTVKLFRKFEGGHPERGC